LQDAATANNVKVEVQAATSITDTTGHADKLAALANQNYNCFIAKPDQRHQPDPGHRQIGRGQEADRPSGVGGDDDVGVLHRDGVDGVPGQA
jgi:hypothetical protein